MQGYRGTRYGISSSAISTTRSKGTDAGKKIVGRKRGTITDTLGLLLAVTAASASDNTIGADLLDQATTAYPTLTKNWVDAGFKTSASTGEPRP